MKRVVAGWVTLVPLVAVLGLLAPPPVHSHAGVGPVPVADSNPCAGGDVHLHGAHTHDPARCPACAAGPAPAAAFAFSASQPRPSEEKLCAGLSSGSLVAPPMRHTRSRAPPADRL